MSANPSTLHGDTPGAIQAGSLPRLPVAIFLILLAAIFVAYRSTWAAMIHLWNTSDTYAHGWLIAPVSLWCLFQLRERLATCRIAPAWSGLPLLLGGGVCWSLGALADVQLVQQLSVVTLIISAALLVFGWECCRTAAFPLGFLFLAVPMGDELTPWLVEMTADFVVFAVQATGIPLYREGNSFVIPSGSWSVVSGCSGIRYLMATITIGVLFAYLNYHSWKRRVAFVGIAILVAIVANWLRAYGIVMIAHFSDMKLALGVDHYIYGWVFFGVVIFLLMSIGMMWSETAPEGASTPLKPASAQQAIPGRMAGPVGAVLGLVLILAWPVTVARLWSGAPAESLPATALLDVQAPAWHATTARPVEWSAHFVGEPQRLEMSLARDAQSMGLDVVWYPRQTQGAELQHAENGLVHEKDPHWRRIRSSSQLLAVPGMPPARESVLVRKRDEQRVLVWQFDWVGGTYVNGGMAAKLATVKSLLLSRGNPAAGLIFFTPMDSEGEIKAARARLAPLAEGSLPVLHRYFTQAMEP